MDLMDLAKGYLEAEGYDASTRGRDLIVGSKRTLGEETEFIYVWVPKIGDYRSFRSREGSYLAKFKEASDTHPFAPKFFLIPTMEGLSTEFRSGSRQWFNVRIRIPAQFFDTTFVWEDSPSRPSAVKDLRERGQRALANRTPQPFRTGIDGQMGRDLLDTLIHRLRTPQPSDKPIHLVVGPAGIGKTFLFEALFAHLYDGFTKDKVAQRLSPRPVPLLPAYSHLSDARTVKALLRAYLREDFARPLESKVFEWMMTHGLAIWLLDGLDEIIAQDPTFFEYLLDLLTAPEAASPPTILICVRDSLLATNEDFRAFCEDLQDTVSVYHLEKWDLDSKRQFARRALDERSEDFIALVRSSPGLETLSSTPYYCHLLVEQFRTGDVSTQSTESEILRTALSSIITREYDKGILDRALARETDVIEFAEALAAEDMEGGFTGVPTSEARELAELILPPEAQMDTTRFVTQMTQLALFSYGGVGTIRFSQEILEHYLLGLFLIRAFDRNLESFRINLSKRRIPSDWTTLRIVADHVRKTARSKAIVELVYQAAEHPIAFKNTLQVAAFSYDRPAALREIPFERKDLSGMILEGLSLRGVSFRECNLSDVTFRNCDLSDVNLEDAIFKNTTFLMSEEGGLRGTTIGNLAKFHSMRVDRGRLITTHTEARRWFEQLTGRRAPVVEPCGAAQQLRFLLGKFVRPDGTPRRSWLDTRGLLSGKRFHDPEEVLETAVAYGYMVKDRRLDRYFRPEGDLYSEFVGYVTSLRTTPGIRALLNDVCDSPGCPHIPET